MEPHTEREWAIYLKGITAGFEKARVHVITLINDAREEGENDLRAIRALVQNMKEGT